MDEYSPRLRAVKRRVAPERVLLLGVVVRGAPRVGGRKADRLGVGRKRIHARLRSQTHDVRGGSGNDTPVLCAVCCETPAAVGYVAGWGLAAGGGPE